MTRPVLFCSTCGHWADKHAGSQGCIGRNDDGADCWCRASYNHIVSTAPAVVKPQAQGEADGR